MRLFYLLPVVCTLIACGQSWTVAQTENKTEPGAAWESLFDGKTMGHWKVSDFGTSGEIVVEEGELRIGFGDGLSGVTWDKPESLPKLDYEIQLQARRTGGVDFFCGLTFPVADSFASLIVGGWGGALVGISSLDGADASHNETRKAVELDDNRWYTIRMRVTKNKLEAWIDKDKLVDVVTTGKKVSIREGIEAACPLGICTWNTSSAVKNIKIRKLDPSEISK